MSFENFIKDKKVLLIGPAPYLYDGSVLEKIPEYDTIVRLNRSIEMIEELVKYTGKRTEVLYHCIDIAPEQGNYDYSVQSWKDKGVQHVRIPYPPINVHYARNLNIFQSKNNNTIENSIVEIKTFSEIKQGCNNTSPNTGTVAIIDILENNPKSLHISGLTFLKGKKIYMDGYRDVINGEELVRKQNSVYKNHSIDFQIEFLKKKLDKYSNITYDKEVSEVLGEAND